MSDGDDDADVNRPLRQRRVTGSATDHDTGGDVAAGDSAAGKAVDGLGDDSHDGDGAPTSSGEPQEPVIETGDLETVTKLMGFLRGPSSGE